MDERMGRVGDRARWVRTGSVFVRAAHLLGASAVLGACLFGVADAAVHPWWIAAGVSGAALVVAELLRHPELWREGAGWATILKLCLVGLSLSAPSAAPWLLSAAFVVAVVGAHAPREWRHRKLF
jgi:hypothetical protein